MKAQVLLSVWLAAALSGGFVAAAAPVAVGVSVTEAWAPPYRMSSPEFVGALQDVLDSPLGAGASAALKGVQDLDPKSEFDLRVLGAMPLPAGFEQEFEDAIRAGDQARLQDQLKIVGSAYEQAAPSVDAVVKVRSLQLLKKAALGQANPPAVAKEAKDLAKFSFYGKNVVRRVAPVAAWARAAKNSRSVRMAKVMAANIISQLHLDQDVPQLDLRYGTLSQMDEALRERGLFSKTDPSASNLCGPACAVNVMTKLGVASAGPIDELDQLVRRVGPKAGVRAHESRERGLWAYELAEMISRRLDGQAEVTALGLHAKKGAWYANGKKSRSEIPLPKLLQTVKDDAAVIVSYQSYRVKQTVDEVDPSINGPGKGPGEHYMILTGYRLPKNPYDPLRVYFSDPYYGERSAQLIGVFPDRYEVGTYKIVFDARNGDSGETNVVTAAIIVKLKANPSKPVAKSLQVPAIVSSL